MNESGISRLHEAVSRRLFLGRSSLGIGTGLGTAVLADLLGSESTAGPAATPRARRVIYLCQSQPVSPSFTI